MFVCVVGVKGEGTHISNSTWGYSQQCIRGTTWSQVKITSTGSRGHSKGPRARSREDVRPQEGNRKRNCTKGKSVRIGDLEKEGLKKVEIEQITHSEHLNEHE